MDVTSSCQSPMNTGVQRMVRGLFRNLQRCFPVTPLVWEPSMRSYCLLSRHERRFLEKPFAGLLSRKARAAPGGWSNLVRLVRNCYRPGAHGRARFDLSAEFGGGDTLLVAEIFPDNRIEYLEELNRATSMKTIAFFHDAITWRRPEITPSNRTPGFTGYMRALGSFQEVVAVSEESAIDLNQFWNETRVEPTPSLRVNPWPVDDRFIAPLIELPRSRRKVNVLCVGTFEPRKNHLALLEAAEKIWREHGPMFELTLIGRATKFFGHHVIGKLRELRRAGRPVRWDRHVTDEKLAAAYDACAFTVFPSLTEGFGLPILESLRRGRPCICGGNGALGERARAGGCLIVDQTNPDNLTDAMLTLLNDETVYSRLVREAHARHFDSWQDFIARLRPSLSPEPALACA